MTVAVPARLPVTTVRCGQELYCLKSIRETAIVSLHNRHCFLNTDYSNILPIDDYCDLSNVLVIVHNELERPLVANRLCVLSNAVALNSLPAIDQMLWHLTTIKCGGLRA